MKILANDGIAPDGKSMLEKAGFEVITEKIAQEKLPAEIKNYDVLIVRSATKVNREVLQNCNGLKLVVRAGVGVDNIDMKAAEEKGVAVANTPNASSLSVAELVFAHLFSLARFLYDSNRQMPQNGSTKFNELKKKYEKGTELRGKTLGLIGFGRIGKEVVKIAYGLGMEVLVYDIFKIDTDLEFDHLPFKPAPKLHITGSSLEEVLTRSDFISLHVPHKAGEPALLGPREMEMMKKGAGIINCSRGGVVNELALVEYLESGKLAYAGLDVFENEPTPGEKLLKTANISLTPHIGASTREAQERIGKEVAQVIIDKLKI